MFSRSEKKISTKDNNLIANIKNNAFRKISYILAMFLKKKTFLRNDRTSPHATWSVESKK